MILFYLDASAWVKRYFEELGSELVDEMFVPSNTLSCSPLGFIEVGSAMARKRSAGTVTDEEFVAKRSLLVNDWRHFLRIEMTPVVVHRAFDLADAYSLRGADSVHLASALEAKAELRLAAEEFTFVASDAELVAAARSAGLIAIDPQQMAGVLARTT